jgi:GTP1/Obg family GTP-binding protein
LDPIGIPVVTLNYTDLQGNTSVVYSFVFLIHLAKKASSDFGTSLIQVGTGLDKAQQQAAKDGIKNFYNDVSNAVVETDKLTIALQNLEKAKIAFIKRESDVQVALEKNRTISKDISKSYTERMNAALEAGRIEQSLTNERLKLAQEEYRIIKEGNALAENKNKDY